METIATPPWWRRWLWLNLMLAVAISLAYLLSVSFEEMREWWNADGYFARRREGKSAALPLVLLVVQLTGGVTAYRSGGRMATRMAATMALVLALVLGSLQVVEPLLDTPRPGEVRDESVGAGELWLIAYIVLSHLAFGLSGLIRPRPAPALPLDIGPSALFPSRNWVSRAPIRP